MEDKDLHDAFDRYVNGQASPEQVKQLLNYFHLERESEILTERVVHEMAKPVFTSEATLEQRQPVYERVQQALHKRISKEREAVVVPLWRKTAYRVAAAAVLLCIGSVAVWLARNQQDMIAINAPLGQMKEVTLPDHSQVWLNAGSQIQYAKNFNGKLRIVKLKGQAFFQVVHEARHPFIVKAGNLSVTVLGTSFEVKAFEKEKEAKVTVASGKVGVNVTGESKPTIFLLPGQQAIFYKADNHIVEHEQLQNIAAWRERKLVFDSETLDNVFSALERKYNVHIQVETPALLQEVTSMKLDNQPLSDVLTVLSFSKHFQYQMANDSTVVIK